MAKTWAEGKRFGPKLTHPQWRRTVREQGHKSTTYGLLRLKAMELEPATNG